MDEKIGMGLVEELIQVLEEKLDQRDPKVDRVAIGVFYTAVKLDSGQAGVAFTPVREITGAVCCPRSAIRMPAAGTLAGQGAWKLLSYALDDSPLKVSFGIATHDGDQMVRLVGEGGSGYFFGGCAEKIVLMR